MPVSIRAISGTTLPVSLTTASTVHVAPLTTASTIHIAPLSTASTIHVAPLTTASSIHASVSGSTVSISPLTTASTIHANVSGSSITVSVTTASSLHADTELPAAAALADDAANPTAPAVAAMLHVWDGAGWDRAVGSTAVGIGVYLQSPITTASTISVSGSTVSVSPLTTASTIHAIVSGSTVSVSGSTISVSPLTTASTIHVAAAQSGTWSLTTATTINVVITAGGGTGGTASVDESTFALAGGSGTPIMGIVSGTDVVSTGVAVVRLTTTRAMAVSLFDAAGDAVAVGGGTQYVIGTTGSTGNTGTVALGYRKDTAATLVGTTGDLTAPIFDDSGRLWVNVGTASITTASTIHAQVAGTVTITTASTIHAQVNALTTASTIHAQVAGTVTVNALTTASTVHAQVAGTVTVNALTTASTIHAVVSGSTVSVTGSTIHAISIAHTAGGSAIFNKLGTTVYESTTVKTSSGQVYGISGYNNTLNPIFVKLYNTTAAPTTALTALWRGIIPATTVVGAAGFVEDFSCPVLFSTGIGIKITGGSLTDGDTAVAATTASLYTVNLRYQ